jgi:hypothetical protein
MTRFTINGRTVSVDAPGDTPKTAAHGWPRATDMGVSHHGFHRRYRRS